LMLWAMDLAAAALPAETDTGQRRSHNPNVFYYVPVNPLFSRGCTKNPSQVLENKIGGGEGVPQVRPWANLGDVPTARASTRSTRRGESLTG
jgi:hypothetical protein